jgi:DNA-directed RNA polymerase subunit L
MIWDDGSDTFELLEMVMKDEPVALASYALKHDLLGRPG